LGQSPSPLHADDAGLNQPDQYYEANLKNIEDFNDSLLERTKAIPAF
jgi:hypothetical protein